jgi:hypothetical protein
MAESERIHMPFDINGILTTEPMHGGTINGWIGIPQPLILMLYVVTVIVIGLGTSFFIKKKSHPVNALKKATVLAFFCAGFLYLIYSERTWYKWLIEDFATYGGHTTEQKTKIFLGPLFDFIATAKATINDSEYTLYSSETATYLMTQYYLLPDRNREKAEYIIVLYDRDAYYDAGSQTFTRGDRKINNAELLYLYDFGAYILKKG